MKRNRRTKERDGDGAVCVLLVGGRGGHKFCTIPAAAALSCPPRVPLWDPSRKSSWVSPRDGVPSGVSPGLSPAASPGVSLEGSGGEPLR